MLSRRRTSWCSSPKVPRRSAPADDLPPYSVPSPLWGRVFFCRRPRCRAAPPPKGLLLLKAAFAFSGEKFNRREFSDLSRKNPCNTHHPPAPNYRPHQKRTARTAVPSWVKSIVKEFKMMMIAKQGIEP